MSVLKKEILFLVIILALYLTQVDSACQSMDASWDPDRGPLVTQPSKSDPTKVMINWSNIIRNPRCVDEYSLWVWRKGTPKERGRKLPIPGQDAVSFIAEVEACVDYSFEVEFLEKNTLWAPVVRGSPISHFRTEAIPQLKSRDKNLFVVGYTFDPAKGLHDLSKVSIKFPKKILEHPNCIKHLEIRGNVDMNALAASQDFSISGALSGAAGKASAPPVNATFRQVPNPVAALMHPEHHHEQGWHGRADHVFEKAAAAPGTPEPSGGKKRTKRFLGKKTTTAKPPIAGPPLAQAVTATILPPFVYDTVEAVVEGVEACKPYIFSLKIVSPRGAVMGEIEGLKLPPLDQILDYHPPSLRSLFQIESISTGQPVIKWQQGLGVPAACLPTFFDAVDLHMQRLEDDIIFHVNQEFSTKMHAKFYDDELAKSQKLTLTQLGCKCNSSVIKLSSTDPITLSKIPHLLGLYHFDSVHQGKPFYRMPSKHGDREPDFIIPPGLGPSTPPPHHAPHGQPQVQPPTTATPKPGSPGGYGSRTKRFIGKVPGSPVGTNYENPYDQPPAYPPPPTPGGIPMWSVPTTTRTTSANWFFPTPPPTIRPNVINIPIQTPPPASPTPASKQPSPYGQPGQSSPTISSGQASPYASPGQGPSVPPPPIASGMKVAFFLYWDPLEKAWLMSNILGGALPWIKGQKNSVLLCPADPGNFKTWMYEDRARPGQWVTDATLKFECVN